MDKIFKIGILVLGFSYLAYLFCPVANQAGRYQYHEDSDSISVLDTCTGLFYRTEDMHCGGELDIVAWGKDQKKQRKEFDELRDKRLIEKLRKEGADIQETK